MLSKRSIIAVLAGMTGVAASGAVFAQLRSGEYRTEKADVIRQSAVPELTQDAEYHAGSYASAPPQLAEGEGKLETQSFCALCHSTRYIVMQPPLPAAVWEAEVNKMVKTFGAPIPEATAKKITAYLQAHYTPETRKP
jgi:cytochrome c5